MEIQRTIKNGLVYMRSYEANQTAEELTNELNLFGDLSLLFSTPNEDIGLSVMRGKPLIFSSGVLKWFFLMIVRG